MTSNAGDNNHQPGEPPSNRIALIGDVHGNLPALEAVLEHLKNQRAVAIWNTGDFVGYGAYPDQVVRLLRERGDQQVIGNYDLKVLKVRRKKKKWSRTKQPLKLFAFEWTYRQLSRESLEYLEHLPEAINAENSGMRLLLTHGSPASIEEPLSPNTPHERLVELAQTSEVDLIISGHSHQPLAVEAAGVWFVNPGSVGRPDDGDPRASYAMLELNSPQPRIEHFRVDYDLARAVAAIRTAGLPEQFAQMVLQGRSLDEIQFANH